PDGRLENACPASDVCRGRAVAMRPRRGTGGSNPVPSSGESAYRRSNSRGRGSGEIPVLQQEPLISEIVAESRMNGLLSADRHFGRNADGPLEWLCCLAPLLRDACWLRFFQLRGEFGICHARSACEITRGPSFSRRSSSILAVSSARKRSSQSRS